MVTITVDKRIPFDKTLRMFELKCRKAKIFQSIHEKKY